MFSAFESLQSAWLKLTWLLLALYQKKWYSVNRKPHVCSCKKRRNIQCAKAAIR